MKKIIIQSQREFDKIKRVHADEKVSFESERIEINCALEVFGILRLKGCIKSSWGKHIISRDSSQVYSESWGSSQVYSVSWDSSTITVTNKIATLCLHAFSVALISVDLKIKIKKSKTAIVQRHKPINCWFERNGVRKSKKIILYKRVSEDFKTQENTKNETLWDIGTTVSHPNWNPAENECGEGKFHACSRAYFCDEFRGKAKDRYIAISVKIEDTYEWGETPPQYPHKIGFREGYVLYECNRYGDKIEESTCQQRKF